MSKRICVFCGSVDGARPAYRAAAAEFGRAAAERGWTIVYGGSKAGLMGAVADAALACGGKVIGVMPRLDGRNLKRHSGLREKGW